MVGLTAVVLGVVAAAVAAAPRPDRVVQLGVVPGCTVGEDGTHPFAVGIELLQPNATAPTLRRKLCHSYPFVNESLGDKFTTVRTHPPRFALPYNNRLPHPRYTEWPPARFPTIAIRSSHHTN